MNAGYFTAADHSVSVCNNGARPQSALEDDDTLEDVVDYLFIDDVLRFSIGRGSCRLSALMLILIGRSHAAGSKCPTTT